MNISTIESGRVGAFFGMPRAPCISIAPVRSETFSATRINRTLREGEIVNVTLPAADAYFVMVYLEAAVYADVQEDGRSTVPKSYATGSVCLVDLCQGVAISLRSSLHSLALVIPKPLLLEVEAIRTAEGGRVPDPPRLVCRRAEADPVIASIAAVLLPLFERDDPASSALLRHLATAICAHLLHNFSAKPDHWEKNLTSQENKTGRSNDDC